MPALSLDSSGRVVAANTLAHTLLGRLTSGAYFASLCDAGSAALVEHWVGTQRAAPTRLFLSDGRRVGVIAGTAPSGILLLSDESEIAKQEALTDEDRRLAIVGRLAAGVAHEINNPLAILALRLELLDNAGESPATRASVQMLREQTARISRIVRDLAAMARPATLRRESVPILDIVETARDQCRSSLGSAMVLMNVPADLCVFADAGRLEAMFVHLLTHAKQAGGASPILVSGVPMGAMARISFEDDGPSVADDELPNLFTPFAHARPSGGNGLGLAIARTIAAEHGGTMTAANMASQGVRITVELALAQKVVGPIAPTPVPLLRPMRLLLVEDEQPLVALITEMLQRVGHLVTAVPTAEQALEALTQGTFDVLLTDLRLPGMDGRALLKRVQKTHPELAAQAILMSGHADAAPDILRKPFRRAELLRALSGATRRGNPPL